MRTGWAGILLAGVCLFALPVLASAQGPGGGGGGSGRGPGAPSGGATGAPPTRTHYGVGTIGTTKLAEPYESQVFCPVSGKKLGQEQPALPIQTKIGEKKPSFLSRTFGGKTVPGAVIYVCCPKCAEAVRANPERYFGQCLADKAIFSTTFTYSSAPNRRPDPPR